ncbi:hypothetical protein LSM04_008276 [Trypanosoma melophagium]|uniref:uncharacterized protein n=1 Tax=Trypanosoma melophagium TaxID=715481 RepID=UPI003519FCB7|nr:hypothetical protein LSM04_008276 [Trypanosoma melophagium]
MWDWVVQWLLPFSDIQSGIVKDGEKENQLKNVESWQNEMCRLENEIDSITGTLTQSEKTLDVLLQKELRLREGLEAYLMEMHDYEKSGNSSFLEPQKKREAGMESEYALDNHENNSVVEDMWKILIQFREKREKLQERRYHLEVTLRCLEAEKDEVSGTLESLQERVVQNSSHLMGNREGYGINVPINPPPVLVEFVEEYRDEMEPRRAA